MAEAAANPAERLTYSKISVHPIAGALGAEIDGVDIAGGVDEATFAEIHRAWLENNAIFFRGQTLSPAQHIAFARRFGDIHLHLFNKALDDHPEITELLKEKELEHIAGGRWHSDQMYTPEPAKATMLYGRDIPQAGGDTMFSNMYAAHDALSDGMKQMLAGLKGINNGDSAKHPSGMTRMERVKAGTIFMAQISAEDAQTVSAHPIIRTHPETGRKALYIGGHTERFEGWSEDESKPLLDYLKAHATRPEFTCRFHWTEGALAFWDNRCCQHFAVNDYGSQRRRMHKVMIKGDAPF